jgi:hypothetical protein
MWGNISKHVGAAIQKVQKLQSELESQLDAAVGAEDSLKSNYAPDITGIQTSTVKDNSLANELENQFSTKGGDDNPVDSDVLHPITADENDDLTTAVMKGDLDASNQEKTSSVVVPAVSDLGKVTSFTELSADLNKDCEDEANFDSGWDFDDKVFESRELKSSKAKDEVISEIVVPVMCTNDLDSQTDSITAANVVGEVERDVPAACLPVAEVENSSLNAPATVLSEIPSSKVSGASKAKRVKAKAKVKAKLDPIIAAPEEVILPAIEAELQHPVLPTAEPEQLPHPPVSLKTEPLPVESTGTVSTQHDYRKKSEINKEIVVVSTDATSSFFDNDDEVSVGAAAPTSEAVQPVSMVTDSNGAIVSDAMVTESNGAIVSDAMVTESNGAIVSDATVTESNGAIVSDAMVTESNGAIVSDAMVIETDGAIVSDAMVTESNGAIVSDSMEADKNIAVELSSVEDTSVVIVDDSVSSCVYSSPSQSSLSVNAIESEISPILVDSSSTTHQQKINEMEKKHDEALSRQRTSFEEQIKRMALEAEALAIADKSLTDFYALAQTKLDEDSTAAENAASIARISSLEKSLSDMALELKVAVTAIAEKDAMVAKLTLESSKLSEVVTERERALETSAVKMAETHKLLEVAQRKIVDLSAEVSEKDAKLRQSQVSSAGEAEVKRQLQRAQEIMREKEERLAAFEQEGQSLSKKQSEMEKVVRTTKAEVKKRDTEIAKLKESKEQLVKAIEEMQDLVRKNEQEASSATKSLSAMQAVSQASTDKLSRLEGDIGSKAEELASQRRAMEAAWAEINESKRVVAELRADRDDLRRQIGLGTSKVMETESSRRDIEQREAVLRATNKQLQDSLQRQMQESGLREERLRDEVGEMRKRWQEAVTSRETLSSELGSATAPLMRQISSMQDSIRSKSESWQAVEASLSERALRAESVAEIAEHRKLLLEEQMSELKLQVGLLTTRLQDSTSAAQTAESALEKLQKLEASSAERVLELESLLALEVGQKQSLQSSLRELELRHKIDQQDARDAVEMMSQQGEGKMSRLIAESEDLRQQLEAERGKGGKKNRPTRLSNLQNSSQDRLSSSSSSGRVSTPDFSSATEGQDYASNDPDTNGSSNGRGYGEHGMQDTVLPSKCNTSAAVIPSSSPTSYKVFFFLQMERHLTLLQSGSNKSGNRKMKARSLFRCRYRRCRCDCVLLS